MHCRKFPVSESSFQRVVKMIKEKDLSLPVLTSLEVSDKTKPGFYRMNIHKGRKSMVYRFNQSSGSKKGYKSFSPVDSPWGYFQAKSFEEAALKIIVVVKNGDNVPLPEDDPYHNDPFFRKPNPWGNFANSFEGRNPAEPNFVMENWNVIHESPMEILLSSDEWSLSEF
jgi:hypothetical protein